MYRYFLVYKPYGMLSQFTREGGHQSLADLDFVFPKDVYPVGRLDADSEGLLILTNDPAVNSRLLAPVAEHTREYLVQVEGEILPEHISRLENGVRINIRGEIYETRPCKARIRMELPEIPERIPPVRFRKNIPTSWLSIELIEGKNRQVRKMTAAVGIPTLRLIRLRIGTFSLSDLKKESVIEFDKSDFYAKIRS